MTMQNNISNVSLIPNPYSKKRNFFFYLQKIDFFSETISYNYNESKRLKSITGMYLTLLVVLTGIVLTFIFGSELFQKKNPTLSITQFFIEESKIDHNKLLYMFNVKDLSGSVKDNIDFMSIMLSSFRYENSVVVSGSSTLLKLKKCDQIHLNRLLKYGINQAKAEKAINQNFCIDFPNDLKTINSLAYTNSTSNAIHFYICNNNNENCMNEPLLDKFFLEIKYVDSYIDSSDFEMPIKYFLNNYLLELSKASSKRTYLSYVNLEFTNDVGLIFSNHIMTNIENLHNIYTETSLLDPNSRRIYSMLFDSPQIQKSVKREYVNIPDLISRIGGFINGMLILLRVLLFDFFEFSYLISMNKLIGKEENDSEINKIVYNYNVNANANNNNNSNNYNNSNIYNYNNSISSKNNELDHNNNNIHSFFDNKNTNNKQFCCENSALKYINNNSKININSNNNKIIVNNYIKEVKTKESKNQKVNSKYNVENTLTTSSLFYNNSTGNKLHDDVLVEKKPNEDSLNNINIDKINESICVNNSLNNSKQDNSSANINRNIKAKDNDLFSKLNNKEENLNNIMNNSTNNLKTKDFTIPTNVNPPCYKYSSLKMIRNNNYNINEINEMLSKKAINDLFVFPNNHSKLRNSISNINNKHVTINTNSNFIQENKNNFETINNVQEKKFCVSFSNKINRNKENNNHDYNSNINNNRSTHFEKLKKLNISSESLIKNNVDQFKLDILNNFNDFNNSMFNKICEDFAIIPSLWEYFKYRLSYIFCCCYKKKRFLIDFLKDKTFDFLSIENEIHCKLSNFNIDKLTNNNNINRNNKLKLT